MDISKVLIANRGEIARRVMRTCKKMGIKSVGIYSAADSNAPFIKTDADESVFIGDSYPSASYLNIPAILDAAKRSNATAIHPGKD